MTQPTVSKQGSILPGPPHHVTILQHTILQHAIYRDTQNTYIHKNESKHNEMGPVRQNPIQRTVRSVHMCTVHKCCIQ